MKQKSQLRTIVAVRQLREVESPRKVVTIKLGKPLKVGGGNWACPYQIDGLGSRKIQYAHGVDAVQALLMALEGIRTALDRSGKQLSWSGGEPGDTGFTRFVPTFFGLDFSKRLDRLIDQEVKRFAGAAESKYKRGT